MISIYIASPYTKGDKIANVQRQIDTANELLDLGFAVCWPLSSHYLHASQERNYEQWMDHDLYWIGKCDVLLRLPGESSGADREVDHAKRLAIPVIYEIAELAYIVDGDFE